MLLELGNPLFPVVIERVQQMIIVQIVLSQTIVYAATDGQKFITNLLKMMV